MTFLETATSSITSPLTFLDTWDASNKSDLANKSDWCKECADSRVLIHPTLNPQMLNFVKDPWSGALYLITSSNTTTLLDTGDNVIRAYRVRRTDNNFVLEYVSQHNVGTNGRGDWNFMGDLDAASGVYISPEGWMVLYTGQHTNTGIMSNGRETVQMGEFSAQSGVNW